jgi:hypothetical protein
MEINAMPEGKKCSLWFDTDGQCCPRIGQHRTGCVYLEQPSMISAQEMARVNARRHHHTLEAMGFTVLMVALLAFGLHQFNNQVVREDQINQEVTSR